VQSPRYDLSEFAGQTIRLDFQVQNDYSHPTTFEVDDVFIGVGGSSSALNVTIGGSGTGMVVSTPAAIACNSSCSSTFDAGSAVTLVATPTPPATFAGWSGDCTGMGNCLLTMDGNKAVIASFAVDAGTIGQPTRIMGAVPAYYPGLAEAYSAAKSGDVIQARSTEFVTNLGCALDKAVTISGGFDTPYATQSGVTRIHGTLSVDRGSLTVDRVEIY
jgi:hypothetical protein